ncbi:unnamed protein product [Mytilus coruscus]|uniref:Uncharacterized protein n=1 Tax=Mytilus coruscus TaxID=42192 RepID=A0A6J8CR96_MYTCO|nr:unnamed protein product [Mytilus coruscus]
MYVTCLISVVNICTKETKFQDASNTVLIKADSTQNCSCELSIINQDHAVTVYIQKFGQEISSSPTQYGCGLILHFGDDVFNFEDDIFWIANCVVDNAIINRTINQGKVIRIRSWTVTGNLKQNEGYCIEIRNNNDDITILAAGASVGGFVIIIVVIVMVCIYRRNHSKPTSKPGPAVNSDTDDYGLRDNVLYVSSEPSDTTQTPNNADSPKTNRISVDIDGNYSTVDLDVFPSVEESTADYSSIDLEKLTPSNSNLNGSTNEKPIIAPKPKRKVTIQDNVYSVPDKKRVKHVTAPGEHGCEYAVVRKPNNSNFDKSEDRPSTSNVYAVVEKKKRMSDGKGTNQKRDSLKAENDEETGQS